MLQLITCIMQTVTVYNLLVLICFFVSLVYDTCISLYQADLAKPFHTVPQPHCVCRSCSWLFVGLVLGCCLPQEDSTSEMPVGTMTLHVRIRTFSLAKFKPNGHYSFQTIVSHSLAFLMFYCYFFIFLSLIVIPITTLITFTIDYVMPFILPNITANNCNLNLLVCFSIACTRVKLSLIVMFSLTRLCIVNVYDMVRFKISSVIPMLH